MNPTFAHWAALAAQLALTALFMWRGVPAPEAIAQAALLVTALGLKSMLTPKDPPPPGPEAQ